MPDRRVFLLVGAMTLLPLTVLAANKTRPTNKQNRPDIQLLEFLGEWQTAKGKWIDPMDIRPEDIRPKTGNKEAQHEK